MVGIGASAGGLEAIAEIIRVMPIDTGMAFVVVQHLAPTYASSLADILSRETRMPVSEVGAGLSGDLDVEPNHVYVIPPAKAMTLESGKLHLLPREADGQPRVIDQFFTSLAKAQAHLAIGVVLSGTASDGTVGLEEIKAAGGITFAQDSSAKFGEMPGSAIDSGCVDFVLAPAQIAAEISRIATHPVDPFGAPGHEETKSNEAEIAPILKVLQAFAGVDFSQYQPNTLNRRIKRRMILVRANGLQDYLRLLREKPDEVSTLCQDALINVTSFFRDPATFELLRQDVIPKIIKDRQVDDPIRIWVVGCSTGEEAYSLAMLFASVADSMKTPVHTQIFATDLNVLNVDKARLGVYSKQRVQDVRPEFLQRYFVETDGAYRVNKELREICVFAKHNVITDPPFSRMDLVSCRNLLIYMRPATQQRVLRTLHYALNAEAYLVLGGSETVGQARDLFGVYGAKTKVFVRKPGASPALPPIGPPPGGVLGRRRGAEGEHPNHARGDHEEKAAGLDVHREAERVLLARFSPPAVLVNQDFDILQFRGETELYLAPPKGRATLNLLKMCREGLLVPLKSALEQSKRDNGPVREERIAYVSSHGRHVVSLEVVPVRGRSATEAGFLVIFEEVRKGTRSKLQGRPLVPKIAEESQFAVVEQELASTREYLQSVIEQMEATNEELQSANEEAQSSNEELQSINEELETSREEIQSSNEELITVNEELQHRNAEIGMVNNDLVNLIGSVNTAIVMVGLDLCIRRFSPVAEKLLNIIPSDVGRPLSNIRTNFDLPNLDEMLLEVVNSIVPKELEVVDTSGRWFSLRIRPYVTLEKKIDGAVMMLVDIDAIKRARDYAESIVQTVQQPIVILDSSLRIRSANGAFYDLFGTTAESVEGRPLFDAGGTSWSTPRLRKALDAVLAKDTNFDGLVVKRVFGNTGEKVLIFSGRKLVAPRGEQSSILLFIEDVTLRRQFEARIAQREKQHRETLEAKVSARTNELDEALQELEGFNYTVAHDLRTPLRGMIFNSTLLLEELDHTLTDEQRQLLHGQARNAKRLALLIDDLLNFSRILRLPVARTKVDATKIVKDVVDEYTQAGGQVSREFEIQEGMTCEADTAQFKIVIANLIENACKFSPMGGKIKVGSTVVNGVPTFFVADEGIGFEMVYAQKVFLPFERLHTFEDFPGTGIGLATVKRIVEHHGGRIWVESVVGKGSTFSFTMAAEPAKSEKKPV